MVLDIISDHVEATVLLQKISSLCAAHGAQWNSDLQVEVDQGCMRLLAQHWCALAYGGSRDLTSS